MNDRLVHIFALFIVNDTGAEFLYNMALSMSFLSDGSRAQWIFYRGLIYIALNILYKITAELCNPIMLLWRLYNCSAIL